MKLKYYMRGMGGGIVLTALVLSIAYRGEQLSDEEIIRRATNLGMVMKEDDSPKLDKLIYDIKPSSAATGETAGQDLADAGGSTNEPAVTGTTGDNTKPAGEASEISEGKADDSGKPANDIAGEGKQPDKAGNADEDKQGGSEDEAGNTDKAGKSDNDEDKKTDGIKPVRQISFTIERGMSSSKVARLLEEKGLIDDAEDFNRYIITKGKASVIRVGTYTLPEGSGYDEIIRTITR